MIHNIFSIINWRQINYLVKIYIKLMHLYKLEKSSSMRNEASPWLIWTKYLLNILQEELWILPQGFCILKNVYESFNFSALDSTVYSNTSWAMHLHYIWVSWKGRKQTSATIKINWSKIHYYNLASLAYSYK